MNKQDLIKKAYEDAGFVWDEVQPLILDNGWVNEYAISWTNNYSAEDLINQLVELDDMYQTNFWRPYALKDTFKDTMGKTERGFAITNFVDRYGAMCSLQKSSLATEDAIWFGVNDANPQIMASDAIKLGLALEGETGWVRYHIPKEVLLSTSMHLTQEHVQQLLPYLIRFAETGELTE